MVQWLRQPGSSPGQNTFLVGMTKNDKIIIRRCGKFPWYCFPCEKLIRNKYAMYDHKCLCKNKDYIMTKADMVKLIEIMLHHDR